MSEAELRRRRADANRLRSEISKTSNTVATKRKKAADAAAASSRTKSPSTARSKQAEAERATRDAIAAEKKRGDLEKKLAEVEVKATKAQERVDKDRARAQDRALQDLQRRTDQAASQFAAPAPPRRYGDMSPRQPSPTPPARDVFLSHASEDKDEIARPLQEALERRGVSVWFDELQITVGQSIRQRIEEGIAHARFGVVVISPHFFAKQWTNAELDAIFSKKMDSGTNLLLPIWHRVSKDEVMQHSPLLAGIRALNTAVMTVDEIADALAEVVKGGLASGTTTE